MTSRTPANPHQEGHSTPPGRRTIADSLVYLTPESLEDLHGPAAGAVTLPIHLDWGPDRTYTVEDDASCRTLYQLTLQNSGSPTEIGAIINAERLLVLWPSMPLPARCRDHWQTAFPQLPRHRETTDHPSWAKPDSATTASLQKKPHLC